MRFTFLVTIGLFMTMPITVQAESGFGTGFTEQSAKAFEDPATQEQDDNMAAAAEKAQDIEPAAGDETGESAEPATDKPENIENDHIFNGEIINDGTFIELTD